MPLPQNLRTTERVGLITAEPSTETLYHAARRAHSFTPLVIHNLNYFGLVDLYEQLYCDTNGAIYTTWKRDPEEGRRQFGERIAKQYREQGKNVLSVEADNQLNARLELAGLEPSQNEPVSYRGQTYVDDEVLCVNLGQIDEPTMREINIAYWHGCFKPETHITFQAYPLGFNHMAGLRDTLREIRDELRNLGIDSKLYFGGSVLDKTITIIE